MLTSPALAIICIPTLAAKNSFSPLQMKTKMKILLSFSPAENNNFATKPNASRV